MVVFSRISLLFIVLALILCKNEISAKNKYFVKVIQPEAIKPPVISSITVNSQNKNTIIWQQAQNENISHFNIYRDDTNLSDSWVQIGKTKDSNITTFTDLSSFPHLRSYQYKISTVDKCGNEIFNTTIHKSIKLTIEEVAEQSNILRWNAYSGFDVAGYQIYRGDKPNNLNPIDTTSSVSYIDRLQSTTDVYYQIEAIGKEDTTFLKYASINRFKSRSNIVNAKTFLLYSDSSDIGKLHIYPNPMTISAIIIFPFEENYPHRLTITDLKGQTVFSSEVFSGEIEIGRKNLMEGMYILQITGKKIYRKKLMVGSY